MLIDKISMEEQVAIFMSGTRFADETEDFGENSDESSLRTQMREELKNILQKGRPLRIYLGVDPTSSNLHVGHFVPLQKLRKFQKLGHQVIFLIGDYTATLGDPSGQTAERKRFSHEQTLEFAKTYTKQAFKILDSEITEIRYNSEWLKKLTFADIIELASIFPMKQIITRRDFKQRMDRGESLRFHEALYSLMQGYDAYALKCDIQVGAYDQHFNLLAGRAIQAFYGETPHVMITNPILIGTDGRKMSKSYGNTINIFDEPFDMYGKTMRISDDYIEDYLILTSSFDSKEISELIDKVRKGENPMDVKKKLALDLVRTYHGEKAACEAEEKFRQVVQKKEAPEEVPEINIPEGVSYNNWIELCFNTGLVKSKGEIRRLITQGGFYIDNEQVKDVNIEVVIPEGGLIIRLGKRKYYKII